MGINLTRLKKLVREAEARKRDEAEAGERHLAMVCGALLAHSPGLRLIEACDTDEGTYATIQETIATSERRTADARAWRATINDPTHPDHPEYKKWIGGTMQEFAAFMNAGLPAFEERCRRQDLAVAAAKKRLGMPADDPDRPFDPTDDPPPAPLE